MITNLDIWYAVRTVGVAGLLLVLCYGCRHSATTGPFALRRHSSGAIERMSMEVSDTTDHGGNYVAWLLDGNGERKIGGFVDGWSGTPVYSSDGAIVGAISNQFYIGNRGALGALTPASAIQEVLQEGRMTRIGMAEDSLGGTGQEYLQPGEFVSILYVWGDVSWGQTGVVSLKENNEAVLLGHHSDRYMGATELAVARATVVGTVGPDDSRAILAVHGAVIGTAFFNSPDGVYAVFGASPKALRLTTTTSVGGDYCSRSYFIAKHVDSRQVESGFRLALTHAMEEVRLAPGAEYDCAVRVKRADSGEELNGEDLTVSRVALLVDASMSTGRLVDKVTRMVAESTADVQLVHVSLVLTEID